MLLTRIIDCIDQIKWHNTKDFCKENRNEIYKISGIKNYHREKSYNKEFFRYDLFIEGKYDRRIDTHIPKKIITSDIIDVIFQFDDLGVLHGYVSKKELEKNKD